MNEGIYYAHSANSAGSPDTLANHLRKVSLRAGQYASEFGLAEEARLAGILHDLGKYGEKFQLRLLNKVHAIDHWSVGAWLALRQYHAIATAVAVHGHHQKLYRADEDSLRALEPKRLVQHHPLGLTLSESDPDTLIRRLQADGIQFAEGISPLYVALQNTASAMLDVRMLFSTLVDADFIETEAHFNADANDAKGLPKYRPEGPRLQSQRTLAVLHEHLRTLQVSTKCSEKVRKLRADLLQACTDAGHFPQGLFTLSAPTGTGKTLGMLAFALRHALQHDLHRIIVVIPYLTIIEQTARIYRDLLSPHFGENYVLEQHSMAGTRREDNEDEKPDKDNEEEALRTARLLAENWDAPIIVTTSVQFLESLFANGPAACRKLHRLARSVILFDEVQTIPARLAVPTLATLARLSERYKATVVFSTATQPAFSHLDGEVRKIGTVGWQPKEIVPPQLDLFCRSRRTNIHWPAPEERISWDDLARKLSKAAQVLCVVNIKAHAHQLAMRLKEIGVDALYHLSTLMCPAHREAVLAKVRDLLDKGKPCRLISTQCVEAGVDVDFPVAYRAWGPLEAVAQVAGRCNRNGLRGVGDVHIFFPEEARYPPGGYEQAADVTAMLLKSRGPGRMDINDTALFEEYYRTLYDLAKIAGMSEGKAKELKKAIELQHFDAVAKLYRIVDQDAISVLVPYDKEVYRQLADEVRKSRLTAQWIRRARSHAVTIFRPKSGAIIENFLQATPLTWDRRERSREWFIYLGEEHYEAGESGLGLVLPKEFHGWYC